MNEYHVRVPVKKIVEMRVKANSEQEALKVGKRNVFTERWAGCTGREWSEMVDENALASAEKIRELPEDTREQVFLDIIYSAGINYTEALYCYENNASLLDFDQWTHLQSIMGVSVSFKEFSRIGEMVDGDILDCTEEDAAMLLRLLLRLRGYGRN